MVKRRRRPKAAAEPERKPVGPLSDLLHPEAGTVALIALLFGLLNSCYTLLQWTRSSDLLLLPVDQVTVMSIREVDDPPAAAFTTRMAYVNLGPRGKPDIVLRESVRARSGEHEFIHHGHSFELFDERDCKAISRESRDAEPVPVDGIDARTHTTLFAPRSRRGAPDPFVDFITLDDLLTILRSDPRLTLTFAAETINDKHLSTTCELRFLPDHLERLAAGCAETLTCERSASSEAAPPLAPHPR